MQISRPLSRRTALNHIVRWVPQAAFVSCAMASIESRAAKAAKQDFSYRDQPKEGKSCASCRQFMPAPSGPGSCAVVDGEISPSGWCMAYSPRD